MYCFMHGNILQLHLTCPIRSVMLRRLNFKQLHASAGRVKLGLKQVLLCQNLGILNAANSSSVGGSETHRKLWLAILFGLSSMVSMILPKVS
jgi:hypothetical protein